MGISISTEIIIFEIKRTPATNVILGFTKTLSCGFKFMKKHELHMHTKTTLAHKM